jgi:hypothetical protein
VAWNDDNELDEEEIEELEDEREDLKSALVQARKKPRNFAIISKGPEVVALVVQKRPIRPGVVRRMRRERGGKQIFEGICQGEGGAAIVFKANGEEPTIKKSTLRNFIREATGLMIKPRFAAS